MVWPTLHIFECTYGTKHIYMQRYVYIYIMYMCVCMHMYIYMCVYVHAGGYKLYIRGCPGTTVTNI